MTSEVLIIGGGEIGNALYNLLLTNKRVTPHVWDINPRKSTTKKDLDDLLEEANFVFLAIPSTVIGEVAKRVKKKISKETIVVSLTKGISGNRNRLSSEILIKIFGKNRIGILGGPMLAEEMKKDIQTKASLGANGRVFGIINPLFKRTNLTLEHSTDIQGVAAAGILKNIYAISVGVIDALNLGDNVKGVIFKESVMEMEILIKKLGGRPKTAYSLAGLGDLEATGNSDYSTNRTLGKKLVTSRGKVTLVSEGSASIPYLIKRIGLNNLPPLAETIYKIVEKRRNPLREIEKYLAK